MATRELRFCWWNVQDFAHFDANRSAVPRWPASVGEYEEKRRRVEAAFDAMFGSDLPEIVGLCELTRAAAEDLQRRSFPDHELVLGDPAEPVEFQVALLLRRGSQLSAREPWFVWNGTSETRPMCVAQYYTRRVHLLFVGCHWTAFETPESRELRGRCADALRDGIYTFLVPPRDVSTPRHVVVFGDFNAEPQDDLFRLKLSASRDRDHARQRAHHADEPVSRTRLYDCGWRLLGEERPHGLSGTSARRVGTCYSDKLSEWRTYDHVLVTGGLLGDQPPYFDESSLLVRTDTGNLVDGKPAKFTFENGVWAGLSDHYPLTGRVVLG